MDTQFAPTGRFAPSPTGALHIGSLVTAVGSYLAAKSCGGSWLLRMDDLDTPRVVPGMADDIMRTLEAFALQWDGPVTWQSRHLDAYLSAFDELRTAGLLYPCGCSRKEIAQSASAPHPDNDGIPYPGTCRNGMRPGTPIRSWRVRTTDDPICFTDRVRGELCQELTTVCGDFALRRGDGEFAYQLAVVVDDHLTGVTQVARGSDLLGSTPRQIHLHRLLRLPQPDYCHLPLVTGPDGAKLSKRDNLISCQPGNCGENSQIMRSALGFLGQEPPTELHGAGCRELLAWGVDNFRLERVPVNGREMAIM